MRGRRWKIIVTGYPTTDANKVKKKELNVAYLLDNCIRVHHREDIMCCMSRSAKCGETHWRKNLGRFMYFYASVESNNSTICRGVVAQDDFP